MLKNEYLLAKLDYDIAENEPLNACQQLDQRSHKIFATAGKLQSRLRTCFEADVRRMKMWDIVHADDQKDLEDVLWDRYLSVRLGG